MESFAIGIVGIISLMIVWSAIQGLWLKIFSEHVSDEDAMADRTKCDNCGCTKVCKKRH